MSIKNIKNIRLIPRIDIKGENVVKGIHLEGLRVVGKPAELAKKYYEQGADEILYMDVVASLYERNSLLEVVEQSVSKGVFIPITVGGGLRTLGDIKNILRSGADKVAINTAAVRNPGFITKASKVFGLQCIVGSIEAKKQSDGTWEAYIDNGREKTGLNAIYWACKLVELGVGELLITSVDNEGTEKGFDIELVRIIASKVDVPIIACGGMGTIEDILECMNQTECDGFSFASVLHYNQLTIQDIKKELINQNFPIRKIDTDKGFVSQSVVSHNQKSVSIIDYNVGNLKSVISAFEKIGCSVKIIENPNDILDSELLVLPGDGTFGYAMEQLNNKGLIKPIKEYASLGKPLLGICLGMQILMSRSEEFGSHQGVNLIEGTVEKFKPKREIEQDRYRVPHIGWSQVTIPQELQFKNNIFEDVPHGSEFYFLHSYYVQPIDQKFSLLNAKYGGQAFSAAIQKHNIYGCQFHPEKSGKMGLEIIKKFSQL